MFQKRIFSKTLELLILFSVFFTPLLFFILSHDQFELPKLTFLALLAIPPLVSELTEMESLPLTPLSIALLLLFVAETAASLPATSLSWRTSLLGDYENFSGLSTFILYLLWFRTFSRRLTGEKLEKIILFNSLAAFFSSLYAIGQHFGLDFIQWNAESVVATREFASLGNPNFLSAYLAMSLPLFLGVSLKRLAGLASPSPKPAFVFGALAAWGLIFLVLGTPQAASVLHLAPFTLFQLIFRIVGLAMLSISAIRFLLVPSWTGTVCGAILLILGLLTTGSRGGFLGAILGLGFWGILAVKNLEFSASFRQKLSQIPKIYGILTFCLVLGLFYILGHSFLNRLGDSALHMGQSLATSRLHIWRPGVKMAVANPVLGVGLDTFKIAFPYYSGIEFNQIDGMFMSSRMAHNELLQMACTTGFLGLAAYLGVLAAFIFMGWKIYRVSSPPTRWLLAAIFASALAYHVQNFFSFGVASLNLLWFLLLAAVQWNYRDLQPESTSPSAAKFLVLLEKPFLALILLVLLWFPLNRLGADIAFGFGNTIAETLKNPDPQTSPEMLERYSDFQVDVMKKAVQLCPLEVKYVLYLGLAYEQRAQLDKERAKDWDLMALDCYEKALQMSPANAYYYNDEGRLCAILSRYDTAYAAKAEEAYAQAVHWDPDSPLFLLNWSNALQKVGKTSESKVPLAKAFQLDSVFAGRAASQIAWENYREGDSMGAYEILAEAIQRNTSCAEAYYCRGILHLWDKDKNLALKDFEEVKSLNPTTEKNPSIQALDEFIGQAKK
jgi:tetratricopeptide (TPR) repeat protein